MIIDATNVPQDREIKGDLCIVGAGAAGIVIAREFAGSTFQVIVLESGGLEYSPETQALNEGVVAGHPYHALVSTRLRYFGGSTNHWAGACRPLDAIDFEQREWVPHSGWPMTRADLDPYYVRAQEVCGLGPFRYDADAWRLPGSAPLTFEGPDVVTTLFQFSAKRRFGEVYRKELEQARNVSVYVNATVQELETDDPPTRISHVRIRTPSGAGLRVSARHVVLATGGLENPRILLLSNRVRKQGLGNEHDLVGRFFMEHPHVYSGIYLPVENKPSLDFYRQQRIGGTEVQAALTIGPDVMRRERLVGFSVTLSPTELPGEESLEYLKKSIAEGTRPKNILWHLRRILEDSGDLALDAYRSMTGKENPRTGTYSLHVRSEQVPNPESRVVLDDSRDAFGQPRVKLIWRLSPIDKRSMRRSQEILAQALGKAALGRLKIELDGRDDSWPSTLGGGSHHIGTTRMHADPRKGVVDPNGRVHGVANLSVAGSSVFPTAGFSNPTLTIVALSLRLADHLKSVLKGA